MGNILIYGGTFDPPHKGHRHLLTAAVKQLNFDRVFLIPAFIPPHKEQRPALSFAVRRGILRDYFRDVPNIEVLDIEERLGGKSYTIQTVETLETMYPDENLYFLMGTDMFLSFEKWVRFEELLKKLFLVVGPRNEGDYEKLLAHKKYLMERYRCKGVLLCSIDAVPCASSEIRSGNDGLVGDVLRHIGSELDENRARHTMQVADYSAILANKFGVDSQKAYLCGLLHDCTKCYSYEWQINYAKLHGILLSDHDLACPQVLHQITAPVFARETFGITDQEILSAIGCHTTGKTGMEMLDLILLFADSCEPSRVYPGVDMLRKIGEENLMLGVLKLLEHTIDYISENKAYLHPQTEAAREMNVSRRITSPSVIKYL